MLKKSKSKRPGKPTQPAAAPQGDPELLALTQEVGKLLDENPEGTEAFVTALQAHPSADAGATLAHLTRQLGKKVLPLLRGLALGDDEAQALAALKALPLLGTRAAGEVLAEAYGAHAEGERGTAAWTGIQALQARGINIEVEAPESTRAAAPALLLREIWESLPDAVGSRQTFARIQDRYGVWQTIALVSNDRAGLKDAFHAPLGTNEWKRRVEQWRNGGIMMDLVPHEFARWQIERFRAMNAETGLALPDPIAAWDEIVGTDVDGYEPPDPTTTVREKTAEEKEHLLGHMECLMHAPAFQSWAIEPADVQPWREEWLKFAEKYEELTDEAVAELEELTGRIANEAISQETVALYRDRLLDCSRKMAWWGAEHESEIAASVVVALDEGKKPGELPFFRQLVLTSLNFLDEILEDGEDPEALRYDPMAPIE